MGEDGLIHMRSHALSAAFAVTALSCGGQRVSVPVPPHATPPVGADCAIYQGAVSGNDEMTATFALCKSADGLSGWVRFASERSGWSDRAIAGGVDPQGRLLLRDTGVIAAAPGPGWELCPVDRYELVQVAGGKVEGSYRSTGCKDFATLILRRLR
jgi:hypothetical protein